MKKLFKRYKKQIFALLFVIIVAIATCLSVSADESCSCGYDSSANFEVDEDVEYIDYSSLYSPVITPEFLISYGASYDVWNGLDEPPNTYFPPEHLDIPSNPFHPDVSGFEPWYVGHSFIYDDVDVLHYAASPENVGAPIDSSFSYPSTQYIGDSYAQIFFNQSIDYHVLGEGDSGLNDTSIYNYNYQFTISVDEYFSAPDINTGEFINNLEVGFGYLLVYNNFSFNLSEDVFLYSDSNGIHARLTFIDPTLSNEPISLTAYGSTNDPTSFDLHQILIDYYNLYGNTNADGEIIFPENVFINTIQFAMDGESYAIDDFPETNVDIDVSMSTSLIARNRSAWFDSPTEWNLPFFESIYNVVRDFVLNDYKSSFELISADYVGWLVTAIGGFFSLEFAPFITIGSILSIIIMMSLVIAFLKVFMGG